MVEREKIKLILTRIRGIENSRYALPNIIIKLQWALRWMHCHHFESPLTTVYSTDRECYLMAMVTLVIQNRVTLARRAIL